MLAPIKPTLMTLADAEFKVFPQCCAADRLRQTLRL